jgi:superfamily II DNA or RNA helicase
MLYDYQEDAHEDALAVLNKGGKALYTAPTGSGKSYVMAANHNKLGGRGLLTVVPSTEIGLGVYDRLCSIPRAIRECSEATQQRTMESVGIWTIQRLYNELMSGRLDPPKFLQFDEAHHTTANTYESVHALCGDCPAVAYTATGFRGTPDETAKLRAKWGEPKPVLTLRKAVERGVISRPDFKVWPLLNDETIKVVNGEFEAKAVECDTKKIVPALCKRIRDELCERRQQSAGTNYRHPKRSTMVTAPGVASAGWIFDALCELDVHCVLITGTEVLAPWGGRVSRQEAFKHVAAAEAVLVQVNVVSEGVDLPIRVQVDTAPCMSPVRWMQRCGRGTRPIRDGEEPPVYICTNHNIGRHAYLWAGLIPAPQIRDAQKAWGPDFKPSRRMFARAIGLEGFGKFVASQVPLVDGTFCGLYALQTPNGTHQYAILLHPCQPEAMFFSRENPHTGEKATKTLDNGTVVEYKVKDYGPWKRVKTIPNADGYVSTKPQSITPKMLDWWKRAAEGRGLDPTFIPNAREFQILPLLCNTGIRFKLEE